jgi:hypothetical protein
MQKRAKITPSKSSGLKLPMTLLCWFFKRLHVQLEEIHKCLHDMKVALTKDISALEIRVVRLETRLNNLMGDSARRNGE